jgi:hypothetical protein
VVCEFQTAQRRLRLEALTFGIGIGVPSAIMPAGVRRDVLLDCSTMGCQPGRPADHEAPATFARIGPITDIESIKK